MPHRLHPKVREAIERLGVDCEVMDCDPELADTAVFCEHYGVSLEASANCIIVASKKEPRVYGACLVTATSRLDVNKKAKQLLGKKLSFATAEQTITLTDMQIGGVTVFGLPADLPLYVDSAIMTQPEIVVGGGNRSSKLKLAPEELKKVPTFQEVEALGIPKP